MKQFFFIGILAVFLSSCEKPSPEVNEDQNRIDVFNSRNGFGNFFSYTIREDDTVREVRSGFERRDNYRNYGVSPGAYQIVRSLMEEYDFSNLNELCGEDDIFYTTDIGDLHIRLKENGTVTESLMECGNGGQQSPPEYDAAWQSIFDTIEEIINSSVK